MKIKSEEKLRPFSHLAGASCLIPGTCWEVTAYPTLLRIGHFEIPLSLTGPVEGFTLEQDLERDCVWVYGRAKEGFYRLRIEAMTKGFALSVDRGELTINKERVKSKGSLFFPAELVLASKKSLESLSLGNFKAQDWEQVQRRADLREILPVLFCLGQKVPLIPPQPLKGTARLLDFPEDRKQIYAAWVCFFKAAFTHLLVPRLVDDQYQGLSLAEEGEGERCFLLQEATKKIRSLFFRQNERRISFLPLLPLPLDAGRMLHLQAPGIGTFDFEWTKRAIRRAILRADTSGEVLFDFQEKKSYRLNRQKKLSSEEPLLIEAGKTYFLDRFQK